MVFCMTDPDELAFTRQKPTMRRLHYDEVYVNDLLLTGTCCSPAPTAIWTYMAYISYTAPYNVLSYTRQISSEFTDHSAGHSIRQSTPDAAG